MLFETRYFWAIFRSKDRRTVRELRAIYDLADTAYVSSISIYEVYKQTAERQMDLWDRRAEIVGRSR